MRAEAAGPATRPGRGAGGTAIAAGVAALVAVTLAAGGAFVALLAAAGGIGDPLAVFDAYLWQILRFTLVQAALSTALSVGFAVPVARAVARRSAFFGRPLLLRLFMLPLGLPPIVAALGLLDIWGRQGAVNGLREALGFETPFSIYGLTGILLAHVFFNMPLAARLLISTLERVPPEYWRLSANLRFSRLDEFRRIEWPAMRREIGGVAALVFMLCVTSFTLVLVLGGGPGATTIEVAIYHALRFEFDPQRAVVLALTQIGVTVTVVVLLSLLGMPRPESGGLYRKSRRYSGGGIGNTVLDGALIVAAAAFLVLPLAAIVVSGIGAAPRLLAGDPLFWRAAATSLVLGAAAAILSLLLAAALTLARHRIAARGDAGALLGSLRTAMVLASSLILVVPPIVIGAGWFVALRTRLDVFSLAPAAVVTINALMALPFVMRVLEPAYRTHAARADRLARSLGIGGANRLRIVDWPVLRRPLALSFAFAMALSLGDLGVIALFGSQEVMTLPFYLLAKMGSYRTDDAAGLALLLGLICFALMALADRPALAGAEGGRGS